MTTGGTACSRPCVRTPRRSSSRPTRRRWPAAATATTSSRGPRPSPPSHTLLDPQGVIRREHHNLMAALQWSEAGNRADLVARLAGTMNRIWLGDIGAGRRWLAAGVAAADDLQPEQRVRVLTVAAHIAVVAMEAADGAEARQAAAAADDEPGLWSSFAVALLCLNTAIRAFMSKDPDLIAASDRLGRKAVELAPDDMARGLAWFWVGQARILTDDFDGAIEALAEGSVEVIPGGDMSPVSLALYAGMLHLVGRHTEALAAATEVFDRAKTYPATGLVGVDPLLLAPVRAGAEPARQPHGGVALHARAARGRRAAPDAGGDDLGRRGAGCHGLAP